MTPLAVLKMESAAARRRALEDTLYIQLLAARLSFGVMREFRFEPKRRWRFDFAWPDRWMAVEVEGGLYVGGRHNRGAGAQADIEKYAEALCRGWRVLRVSGDDVKQGRALQWIERMLKP